MSWEDGETGYDDKNKGIRPWAWIVFLVLIAAGVLLWVFS